jgi:hypothetical protein
MHEITESATAAYPAYEMPISPKSLHLKRIDIRVLVDRSREVVIAKGTIHILSDQARGGVVIVHTDPVYTEPGVIKGEQIWLRKEHMRFLKYSDDMSSEETFTCYDPNAGANRQQRRQDRQNAAK